MIETINSRIDDSHIMSYLKGVCYVEGVSAESFLASHGFAALGIDNDYDLHMGKGLPWSSSPAEQSS